MKIIKKINRVIFAIAIAIVFLVPFSICNVSQNKTQNSKAYIFKENNYISELASDSTLLSTSYSLVDEYPILSENQTSSNLCWIYASLKSLETSLMVQKSEYTNFSEIALSYIAYEKGLLSSYDISGNFYDFVNIAYDCGLVYESDFSNELYFDMSNSNLDNYKYVLEKSTKSAIDSVNAISFEQSDVYTSSNLNKKQILIKKYLQKYGGLFCGIEAGTIYTSNGAYLYSNDPKKYTDGGVAVKGNHAVCLIGWDDEFGFLALNSWGVEEPESYQKFYIPFSYEFFYSTLGGFVSNNSEENIILTNSSASEFSGVIRPSTNVINNIICYDERISLTYNISNSVEFKNVYAEIYKGSENVTSSFQLTYDDTAKTTTVTDLSLPSFSGGTYLINFYEGNKLIGIKSFFIFTGTEISYFKINKDALSSPTDSELLMNSFVNSDNSETYYLENTGKYKLYFYLTGLNSYKATQHLRGSEEIETYKVEFEVGDLYIFDANGLTKTDAGFSFGKEDGNLKDWANTYVVNIQNLNNYSGKRLQFSITLTSTVYRELKRTYYVNIFVSGKSSISTESSKSVTYYLDGGKNSELNPMRVPNLETDTDFEFIKLEEPTKPGFTFMGWYDSETYENQVDGISSALGDNIKLYARWNKDATVYFTTDLEISTVVDYEKKSKELTTNLVYGDSIKLNYNFYELSDLAAFSYNASYKYFLNDTEVSGENLGSGNKQVSFSFMFPELVVGTYKIDIYLTVVVGHNKSLYDTKSLTFIVSQKVVDFEFEDLEVTYDKQTHIPTIKTKGLGFYAEDLVDKTLLDMISECSSPKINAGTYVFEILKITNNNYKIGENSCEFKIIPRTISVEWSDLEKIYNGKNQEPTYKLKGLIEGDDATISLLQKNMKNVGEYDVSIAENTISNINYKMDSDEGAKFVIKPAKITITFKNIADKAKTSPEYRRKVSYTISGTIYDPEKDLALNIVSDAFTSEEKGKYNITGTCGNTNYDVTFVDAIYTLYSDYYIFYTLPDGTKYTEHVEEDATPKGITKDIYKLPLFAKFKYSESLDSETGNVHVDVTIVNYTWAVVVGTIVLAFVVIYLAMTHKQRRNKVS